MKNYKTFIEILKYGVEGYSLTDIVDNITDEEIELAAIEFAQQFTDKDINKEINGNIVEFKQR